MPRFGEVDGSTPKLEQLAGSVETKTKTGGDEFVTQVPGLETVRAFVFLATSQA